MQYPRWYARFNKMATNKVVNLWAGRTKGMGILNHVGRTSGQTYRTPLVVFPLDRERSARRDIAEHGGVLVQVGYGPKTQWVLNATAAGGATMDYRGQVLELGPPITMPKPEAINLVPRRWRLFYRVVPFDVAAVFPLTSMVTGPSAGTRG